MPCKPILAAACLTGLCLVSAGAFAGDESTPAPAPKCEVAVVNPVSGYAECVKPRGASVDQPPPRPPPSPEECAKHPDLAVEACRQKQPSEAEAPKP